MYSLVYEPGIPGVEPIDLSCEDYTVGQATGLRSTNWSYTLVASGLSGVSAAARETTLTVSASTPELFDRPNMIFDAEMSLGQPGTLVIDGQWQQKCYVTKTSTSTASRIVGAPSTQSWTVVLLDGMWTRLTPVDHFTPVTAQATGLDLPTNTPFDLTAGGYTRYVQNDSLAPEDWRMTIFGPVTGPHVTIGSNIIELTGSIPAGSYATIDTRTRTITLTDNNGVTQNVFEWGVRSMGMGSGHYVFERIPAGQSVVSWPSTFSFDLQLVESRMDPTWGGVRVIPVSAVSPSPIPARGYAHGQDVTQPVTVSDPAKPVVTVPVNPVPVPSAENSSVSVSPQNPTKGDTVTVSSVVKDKNGTPIAGREVTVVLPDGTEVPAVTDKDGKIVGKDGQPITFTAGDKDGEVKFYDGSDTAEPAKPVVTAPVHVVTPVEPVKKADPDHSSVTVSPANPNKGGTVLVSGVVKDSDGKPLAGREVTVVLPDGTRVPGVTNDKGEIVSKKDGSPITFVADKSGDMKLFDGTSADGETLASVTVTVSEPKPAVIGDGSSVPVNPQTPGDDELNPGDTAVADDLFAGSGFTAMGGDEWYIFAGSHSKWTQSHDGTWTYKKPDDNYMTVTAGRFWGADPEVPGSSYTDKPFWLDKGQYTLVIPVLQAEGINSISTHYSLSTDGGDNYDEAFNAGHMWRVPVKGGSMMLTFTVGKRANIVFSTYFPVEQGATVVLGRPQLYKGSREGSVTLS